MKRTAICGPARAGEARLGPTLAGVDAATLVRTLLPHKPIDAVDTTGRSPGAAVAAAIGLLFTSIALVGERWMGLFSADPVVREIGVLYLRCQAAVFPFTGAALACYFATVGLGTVVGPFLLALLRIAIAVAGGWLALQLGDGLVGEGPVGLFLASSVAFVTFALGLLLITRRRFDALTRR